LAALFVVPVEGLRNVALRTRRGILHEERNLKSLIDHIEEPSQSDKDRELGWSVLLSLLDENVGLF